MRLGHQLGPLPRFCNLRAPLPFPIPIPQPLSKQADQQSSHFPPLAPGFFLVTELRLRVGWERQRGQRLIPQRGEHPRYERSGSQGSHLCPWFCHCGQSGVL